MGGLCSATCPVLDFVLTLSRKEDFGSVPSHLKLGEKRGIVRKTLGSVDSKGHNREQELFFVLIKRREEQETKATWAPSRTR